MDPEILIYYYHFVLGNWLITVKWVITYHTQTYSDKLLMFHFFIMVEPDNWLFRANTMAADALAPKDARASAAMV